MIESALTGLLHLAHDPRVQSAASGFGGRIAAFALTVRWRRWRQRRRKRPERIIEGASGAFRWRRERTRHGTGLVFVGRSEEESGALAVDSRP